MHLGWKYALDLEIGYEELTNWDTLLKRYFESEIQWHRDSRD
jgi:hypothetical protein